MSCLMPCCVSLTCGLCTSVASSISRRSARIAYCGLFGISLIVSWVLREYAAPILEKLPWIVTTASHSAEWYQTEAVLRVSLGNFLFFAILAVIMIGVKDQNDNRDLLHHGGWVAKVAIWVLFVVLMFFMPDGVITVYGVLSKFGAGLFLLVQVIILLDATHSWNDAWVAKDEHKWYMALLSVSGTCYIGAFTLSGLLFFWFNPSGHQCGLNISFIVITIILSFAFALIALHPQVNGSLLPASVMSVYCAYLCYTTLSCEPRGYECNSLHDSAAASTSTLVLGLITTVFSVLYSALRAGSSTTFLSSPSSPTGGGGGGGGGKNPLLGREDQDHPEVEEGKKELMMVVEGGRGAAVSYSYTFFHLIFALASMYSGMLLSAWTNPSANSDYIDVGWTSVWVKACTQWVTAALYIWTLVAPLVFPDREFY